MTPLRPASWFSRFSRGAARGAGHPIAFALAVLILVAWGVAGPACGWSDSWQLVINTGTTIVTFLMVFVIQNTQERDATAMHVKLDELIRAVAGAHLSLVHLEESDLPAMDEIRDGYAKLRDQAHRDLSAGHPDTGVPDVEMPTAMEDES